jgi:hypothetical protein
MPMPMNTAPMLQKKASGRYVANTRRIVISERFT